MISLLITSKINQNPNWGLRNLLQSLVTYSSDYSNFEVLIKFDTEDPFVSRYVRELGDYPFQIRYLVEPRGRGYIDIHLGYTRLMSIVDDKSKVIGCFADDFVITEQNWDADILEKSLVYDDNIFVLHQRPHPPHNRPNLSDNPFCMDAFELDDLENLYIIDEGPFWGRKLIEICGGLGHISFTDAWTIALEHFLYNQHSINRTVFLPKMICGRITSEIDTQSNIRWTTDRQWNFDFMKTDFYRTMVKNQANNIHLNIKNFTDLGR